MVDKTKLLASGLFLSLTLNLLLGGIVAGRMATGGREPIEARYAALVNRHAGSLEERQRARLEEALANGRALVEARRKDVQEQRDQVRQLLAAPVRNIPQIQQAFADDRRRMTDMQIAMQAMMLETSGILPAEARAEVMKGLKR